MVCQRHKVPWNFQKHKVPWNCLFLSQQALYQVLKVNSSKACWDKKQISPFCMPADGCRPSGKSLLLSSRCWNHQFVPTSIVMLLSSLTDRGGISSHALPSHAKTSHWNILKESYWRISPHLCLWISHNDVHCCCQKLHVLSVLSCIDPDVIGKQSNCQALWRGTQVRRCRIKHGTWWGTRKTWRRRRGHLNDDTMVQNLEERLRRSVPSDSPRSWRHSDVPERCYHQLV